MRVLFVSPEFAPNIIGGVGIYLYYIIKYLLKLNKDISIEVLTFSGKTEIGKDFEELPIKVIRLKKCFPYQLRILEFYIKTSFFIFKNKNRYDLIHDNYNAAISWGIPVIHTVHSTRLQEFWYSESISNNRLLSLRGKIHFFFLHCLEVIAFKKAYGFIVPSKELKEHLGSNFNIKKNIFIVRHGVDSDLFKPKDELLKQRKYNIAFFGRLVSRKGLKYLFRALELLENKTLKILFCAANIDWILFYIEKLKQNPRHKFYLKNSTSYLSMPSLYLESDIVVLPSLYESFSLTAVEAMACATPVVITKVGGLQEIIENRIGAIFVQPKDSEELARNISYLLDNPEERTKIGLAGREKVIREFNWLRSAIETYNVYDVLLEKYKK